MKNVLHYLLLIMLTSISANAQEIATLTATDWRTMRKSGFYECHTSLASNTPGGTGWYWGINIAHSLNSVNTTKPYYYGGQIAFFVNNHSSYAPHVYVRSTTELGDGIWAKVVHSKGNHTIEGQLTVDALRIETGKVNNLVIGEQGTPNSSGSVNRFTIFPYGHTGRWTFSSRDIPGEAYLDIGYSTNNLLTLNHNNRIGILTQNPQYALDVNGIIRATEVKIEISSGSDFVFRPDYDLMPLSEVESFVKENQHLPEIPSEKEMIENGVSINEMQIKLLQKVEELTLYVIEQDKQNKKLQEQVHIQEERIKELENK